MKHCLTVINHGWVPIDPLKATLVTVAWRLIVALVSLRLQWGLAWVLCGMPLTPQYRCFSQMTLWSHGNEPQSQWGKAKTIGCVSSQSTVWPPSCQREPVRSQCLSLWQSEYMLFFGILANFRQFFLPEIFGVHVWNLAGLLSGCLCSKGLVCRTKISQWFSWAKLEKKVGI